MIRFNSLSQKTNNKIIGIVLATPSLLVLFTFFLIPVGMTLHYSLTDWNGIASNSSFIGLNNFKNIFSDKSFYTVLKNTFYLAVIYVPVLNIIALFMAILIVNVGKIIGNICKSILFFPNLLSMVVVGFIWKILLNYNNGFINIFLRSIGVGRLASDWLGSINLVLPSISASILWFATGYFIVIYISGLVSIPTDIHEACDMEGANVFQKFFIITLPLLSTSITINIVLSTIGIISTFDLPYVLTNGGPGYASETIALQIYHYAFSNLQQGRSLALSIILMFIAISVSVIELKFLRKKEVEY
jgi:multiple sugar transport system permease protein/raffinose/stachyose/melibiose transport system permease protein